MSRAARSARAINLLRESNNSADMRGVGDRFAMGLGPRPLNPDNAPAVLRTPAPPLLNVIEDSC